jgi:predicted transcriptional regulator
MPPITRREGFLQFSPLGMRERPMLKSTGDIIWAFIVICNERKAFKKLREYEAFIDHEFDEWVIAAICEYQLLLPLEEFMATGFVGRVV